MVWTSRCIFTFKISSRIIQLSMVFIPEIQFEEIFRPILSQFKRSSSDNIYVDVVRLCPLVQMTTISSKVIQTVQYGRCRGTMAFANEDYFCQITSNILVSLIMTTLWFINLVTRTFIRRIVERENISIFTWSWNGAYFLPCCFVQQVWTMCGMLVTWRRFLTQWCHAWFLCQTFQSWTVFK